MPRPLWIMLLTCFAITMASPILIAVLLLLVPGRKGTMRTVRTVRHDDLSVEQVRSLYAARLVRDGFVIDALGDSGRLRATRPRSVEPVHTISDKAVGVEITLTPDAGGTRAEVAAWVKDFVFFDSGEGRFVDLALQRLISPDPNVAAPPAVPTVSFVALSGLVAAALGIAEMAFLVNRGGSPTIETAGVIAGGALACVAAIFMVVEAMKQIRRRPAELTGRSVVLATVVLSLVGIVGGIAVLYVRFGPTLAQAARRHLR
jgi:hypothetical protein